MAETVLSICIPTYNRRLVLLPDIKRYLSICDNRFVIKVNDNCSSDGTYEELQSIKDERLQVRENDKNYGGLINGTLSLQGATSRYIMYLLDKDTIDTYYLSDFLDYLERESPNFGYIDLSNKGERHIDTYKAGKEAILKVAYKSKHPSGFFWKTCLFEAELSQNYIKQIDDHFEFLFDLMAGTLASKYDATVVHWPLIINANLRKTPIEEYKKSYTYNEANIYFGLKQLERAFNYYLSNLMTVHIPLQDKKEVARQLTDNFLLKATISLKRCYSNNELCVHYNMETKKVGFFEMQRNSRIILKDYRLICSGHLPLFQIVYTPTILWLKSTLRIVYLEFKHFIKGPDPHSFSV